VATGAAQVQTGAEQLSQGLASATQSIPTYSDTDISTTAAVVSQPVRADQPTPVPGLQTVPLFVVLALWFGSMVIVLARRAVPVRELLSTVPSGSIALRSVASTAALGAVQGLLIAAAAEFGLTLGIGAWLGFASLCLLVGAAFAVVNQGLVAAFGVVGRFAALVVGILALTVGLSSTVPPLLAEFASLLPTAPALAALRAAVVGDTGAVWAAVAVLVIWSLAGAALVFAGVAARRGLRIQGLIAQGTRRSRGIVSPLAS
jgi:putative membrane protein